MLYALPRLSHPHEGNIVCMNEHMTNDNVQDYKRAKEPKTPVAGPYGHPIHPLLVTVPIGAWMSSVAFDLIGPASEDEWAYAIGAKRLIDIGLVTATGAAMFGLLDFLQIPPRTRAWYSGIAHMALNAAALGMFAMNSASRGRTIREHAEPAVTWYQRGMSVMTAMSLLVSGWIGGSLTYHYGVRVADEDHQKHTGFTKMDNEAWTQAFMENLR
jgi:uncharacterized membrane protein